MAVATTMVKDPLEVARTQKQVVIIIIAVIAVDLVALDVVATAMVPVDGEVLALTVGRLLITPITAALIPTPTPTHMDMDMGMGDVEAGADGVAGEWVVPLAETTTLSPL